MRLKSSRSSPVFTLFKKYGKGIKRNKIYPKILKDQFDFPETAKDIEKKAMVWLDEELPKHSKTVRILISAGQVFLTSKSIC